jgi:4-amino-4-deoxy-L-arabinose transferase-like glycosyltransferase
MEFPLMQWMVASSYFIFGNHIVVTRIFMFLFGLVTTLGLFVLLKILFRNSIPAVIGAWGLTFSPTFFYHTINPMPDNMALCCAVWGMVFFFRGLKKNGNGNWLVTGFLFSLAALIKLPFILYFILPVYAVSKKGPKSWKKSIFRISSIIVWIFLPVFWYITVIPQWGANGIVKGIIGNQLSWQQTLDYWQHNLISNLPELLLNYGSLPFFLAGIYFLIRNKAFHRYEFRYLSVLGIFLLLYYLFESNMIGKSHDYYLFPFLPPMFIVVGYGGWKVMALKPSFTRPVVIMLLLILPLTCYLRLAHRWNPEKPGFNKNLLEHKTDLRNAIPGDALVIAGNDPSRYIFFYYIDKKGWGFERDWLSADTLSSFIDRGATYLYSDSRATDERADILPYLDRLVLERGNIRIYRLKKLHPSHPNRSANPN